MNQGPGRNGLIDTPPRLQSDRQFETETPGNRISPQSVVVPVENAPSVSTRALDTTFPEPTERRVYIGFSGVEFARLARPLQSGSVDPTEIQLLTPEPEAGVSESVVSETSERLQSLSDVSVDTRQIAWATESVPRIVAVYDLLDSILTDDTSGSVEEIAINLTASEPSIELEFFTAIATYVLDNPSQRPRISIYYVSSTESIKSSPAAAVQPTENPSSLKRNTTDPLSAYLTQEFEGRLERIRTAWAETRHELPADVSLDEKIPATLDDIEAAIYTLDKNIEITQLHALEKALWELTDRIDNVLEQVIGDTNSHSYPDALDSLRNEIDRFDDAVTTLHSVVRDHRREFRQQVTETPYASSDIEMEISTNTGEDTVAASQPPENPTSQGLSVQQLPLPPLPTLSDEQARLLKRLADDGPFDSVSALSRALYEDADVDIAHQSYKSKVQYNVRTLEERGYVTREPQGRSYRTMLSAMGHVWIQTHNAEIKQ